MIYNPDDRRGNDLPPVVDQDTRVAFDREDMLYSYHNTVESSYVGDIRHIVAKMGDYLKSKNKYYDVKKQEYIEFPIRYGAPNLVFSDNKGLNGVAEETSIKDRLVLPIISYYLKGLEYDSKRAIDPCVRYFHKPDKLHPGKVLVTTAPKMMKYSFQVDLWTENREPFYQLVSAFQLDFNPYSYLIDLYSYDDETQKSFYLPYVKMSLTGFSDASNFVPGTDRRVVRGTFNIDVDGFLSQPPTQKSYVFNTIITTNGIDASAIGSSVVRASSSGTSSYSNIVYNTPTVESVFGRIGDVSAEPGDYTATEITINSIAGLGTDGDTVQEVLEGITDKIAKDTFTIRLSQPMTSGTLFRIINNKAYPIKSIDSIVPFVDGILLASGNTDDVVEAGRKTNTSYETSTLWNDDNLLYLSQTGTLTPTIPSAEAGDKYGLIVGRSLKGTTSFTFDPKTPIGLI
jgi:hypothetical protein